MTRFEHASIEEMSTLPAEVLRGFVKVGAEELMRRGEPLPTLHDLPQGGLWQQEPSGHQQESGIAIANGRIQVFPNYGDVRVDGQTKRLTPKVYATLFCLATKANQLVKADELIAACWPQSPPSTMNCLSQLLTRLRVALGPEDLGDPQTGVIRNVQKHGWVALTSLRNDPRPQIVKSLAKANAANNLPVK